MRIFHRGSAALHKRQCWAAQEAVLCFIYLSLSLKTTKERKRGLVTCWKPDTFDDGTNGAPMHQWYTYTGAIIAHFCGPTCWHSLARACGNLVSWAFCLGGGLEKESSASYAENEKHTWMTFLIEDYELNFRQANKISTDGSGNVYHIWFYAI